MQNSVLSLANTPRHDFAYLICTLCSMATQARCGVLTCQGLARSRARGARMPYYMAYLLTMPCIAVEYTLYALRKRTKIRLIY